MDGSVGKALRDARLQKKLTVEEAARATKIRADRLADLERDDYARFPNLAYARGFLLMYAKFVGVDISKYQTVDVGNSAGVGDYQYLQNEGGVDSLRFSGGGQGRPIRRSRWLLAGLVFLGVTVLGTIIAFFVLDTLRLGSMDQLLEKEESRTSAVSPPAAAPVPVPSATAAPSATPTPFPEVGVDDSPEIEPLPGALQPMEPLLEPEEVPPAPSAPESVPPRALPADGSSPPPLGAISIFGEGEIAFVLETAAPLDPSGVGPMDTPRFFPAQSPGEVFSQNVRSLENTPR